MSRKDLETVETWRSALREGDPALGVPNFDPQVTARMRRAVLAAAQEQAERPRLVPWLSPVWGAAITAVAALLLVLGLWWLPDREQSVPERIAVHAPVPVPQASPALPPVQPAPEEPAAEPAPPEPPRAPAPPPLAAPPVPAPAAEPEMALAELPVRNPGRHPRHLGARP
jgi:hypothetical protein